MNIRSFVAGACCALFAGIAAAAAAVPEQINIVYVKAPFNLQNIVIKQNKMLEKEFAAEGVKINWKPIMSGANQAQAMAAGAIDISAVMNTASLLLANGAGNEIYAATGVAHPSDVFAIVGRKGEQLSIRDLRGKKVAGPQGTVLHQLLIAALAKEGMSAKDVEFISMGIPQTLAAVSSGNVEAGLLAAGTVIKAEENGCKVITTAKDLVNVNLVLTVSKGFAEKYPQALERVVKVHRDSLKWIKANWDKAIEMGAKEQGISVENAKKLGAWSNYYDTVTDADIAGLAKDQKFLLDNGLMRSAVDVEKLVLPIAKQ